MQHGTELPSRACHHRHKPFTALSSSRRVPRPLNGQKYYRPWYQRQDVGCNSVGDGAQPIKLSIHADDKTAMLYNELAQLSGGLSFLQDRIGDRKGCISAEVSCSTQKKEKDITSSSHVGLIR